MLNCEGSIQSQPKQHIAVTIIINQYGSPRFTEEEADFIIFSRVGVTVLTLLVQMLCTYYTERTHSIHVQYLTVGFCLWKTQRDDPDC